MFKNNLKKYLISFSIVIFVFFLDRITKLYILNLAESEKYVDIYLNSFLNFYLIWNKGIGFGLFQLENSFFYNFITALIIIINIIILVMIIKSKDYKIFFLLMILGGSSGNLFDRLYFKAVPDFIDLHYESFHWFIFNVADIFISIGLICLIIAEFILNNKKDNEKN
tara:strand:+ start:4638 stop:5138 length:501 start_codon:yes stop_codon:yes gene_type:complete